MADTGDAAAAMMIQPDFDFTRQAVLSMALDVRLVPARNMQMLLILGGLHVSGSSDGTSLVVLPQQFSHCLRARDGRVRLVRANLMMTGLIFSGDVDTDIVFDYGIFTPRCRWGDLSDIKRLKCTSMCARTPSTLPSMSSAANATRRAFSVSSSFSGSGSVLGVMRLLHLVRLAACSVSELVPQ